MASNNNNNNYDHLDKILEEADRAGRGQYRRQRNPQTGKEEWVNDAGKFVVSVNQQLDDIEKYLRS